MGEPAVDTLSPGSVVGERYEVTAKLGQGGMGTVYRARHGVTGADVALKVLSSHFAQDPAVVKRFVREARTAMQLDHPHIARVHDIFVDADGTPVMVMELLHGGDLGQLLDARGRLDLEQTAQILVPTLHGLALAHSRGVVHRDLKPDNIFLSRQPGGVVPKILDFGIAKVVSRDIDPQTMHLTSTGTMLGTPYYMSPEQISGQKDIDHRTDLWAVGVILYECLAGRRPFLGENFGQLFAAVYQGRPPELASLVPDLPPEVLKLVQDCLANARDARPATCGTIAAVLEPFAGQARLSFPEPIAVRGDPSGPISGLERTAAPSGIRRSGSVSGMEPTLPSTPEPVASRGRWPRVAVAIAVLVLVAAGITAAVLWSSGGAPGPAEAPEAAAPGSLPEETEPPAAVPEDPAPPAPGAEEPPPEPVVQAEPGPSGEAAEASDPATEPEPRTGRSRPVVRHGQSRHTARVEAPEPPPTPMEQPAEPHGVIGTLR